MSEERSRAQSFKLQVETKIKALLVEFAQGNISREQFHAIYEKYNAQLEIVNHAMMSGNPDAVSIAEGGPPTIAIRDAYMGKVMGLLIFHNKSGKVVETLGDFSVAMSAVAPTLNDITRLKQDNKFAPPQMLKFGEKQWLLFAAGRYTTVVAEFIRQPAEFQTTEIERLHHDFEEANRTLLENDQVFSGKLAYPFLVFIRTKPK
ncbi:MAG: hypothetical protein H7Y11_01430 [Armatimonadetes bacterium]|nr:hypothetical protein [Anaerolineae bacterium]